VKISSALNNYPILGLFSLCYSQHFETHNSICCAYTCCLYISCLFSSWCNNYIYDMFCTFTRQVHSTESTLLYVVMYKKSNKNTTKAKR